MLSLGFCSLLRRGGGGGGGLTEHIFSFEVDFTIIVMMWEIYSFVREYPRYPSSVSVGTGPGHIVASNFWCKFKIGKYC